MNKVLALGGHKELKTVKKRLYKSNLDVTIAQFADLEIFVASGDVDITLKGQSLRGFDYVWLTSSWRNRSDAYAVFMFLKANGVDCNQVEAEKSKLVDMILFALKGISIPKTYFCRTENIQSRLVSIEGFCNYPFIIKPTNGSLGRGIHLVNSREDFVRISMQLDKKQAYICQEFIPNTFDYRVIIGNDEIVSVCQRHRVEDGFRNNTYLGAKETFLDPINLPKSIINIAKESASALKLSWAGVDIVSCSETGQDYIIELNRRPGFSLGTAEISAAYDYLLYAVAAK